MCTILGVGLWKRITQILCKKDGYRNTKHQDTTDFMLHRFYNPERKKSRYCEMKSEKIGVRKVLQSFKDVDICKI